MAATNVGDILARYQRGELGGDFEDADYVPDGTYEVEVIVAKAKEHQITLFGRIQSGALAGTKVGLGNMSTKGKTEDSTKVVQGIFMQNLTAWFGGPEPLALFVSTNPDLGRIADALKGRKATVELVDNSWGDNKRNQIKIGRIQLTSAPGASAVPTPVVLPQAQPVPPQQDHAVQHGPLPADVNGSNDTAPVPIPVPDRAF